MASSKRILLVDRDLTAMAAIQKRISVLAPDWELVTAGTTAEGLVLLNEDQFDVIAVDAQLPAGDGETLLHHARARFPRTLRFALSTDTTPVGLADTIELAHQWLTRPIEVRSFISAVARVSMLSTLMASPILQQMVTGVGVLPTLPAAYAELIEELQASDVSVPRVSELIAHDVAISAKVLQLVNSAYFSLRQQVTNLQQAVVLLGLDTVRALAQTAAIFSMVESERTQSFIQELYNHAIVTGQIARKVARELTTDREIIDRAILGGMLHDIGKLILATYVPQDYFPTITLSQAAKTQLFQAEQQIFGATHAEMGAYLLGLWGFQDDLVIGVGYHHRPSEFGGIDSVVLSAIHVADIQAKIEGGLDPRTAAELVDHQYLDLVGYTFPQPHPA